MKNTTELVQGCLPAADNPTQISLEATGDLSRCSGRQGLSHSNLFLASKRGVRGQRHEEAGDVRAWLQKRELRKLVRSLVLEGKAALRGKEVRPLTGGL